jgi:hypothetical protein
MFLHIIILKIGLRKICSLLASPITFQVVLESFESGLKQARTTKISTNTLTRPVRVNQAGRMDQARLLEWAISAQIGFVVEIQNRRGLRQ